ncbi:MAG TPA: hypothetical protein VEI97_00255 [bacterium]|nr:hypothetical protein [bacterium]
MPEPPQQPKADSINRGTAAILLSQVVALVLTWAAHLLVAHHPLVKAHSGSYAAYTVLLGLVLMFAHLIHYGLPSAVGKWVAEDREYAGYFLSRGWILQGYFIAALVALALAIGPVVVLGVIKDPSWWPAYLAVICSIPAYAYFNQRTSVMGGLRLFTTESKIYAAYAMVRFLGIVAALAVLGEGVAPGPGSGARLRWMLTAALFANTLAAVVGFVLARQATRFQLGYREDPDMAGQIIRFVLPNIGIIAMLQLLMRYDHWAVVAFSSDPAKLAVWGLGWLAPATPNPQWGDYYAGGNNLANLFFTLGASMYATTYPTIAALKSQGDDAGARAIMVNSMRALAVVGAPMVALTAAATEEAMAFLYPAEYAAMGNALPILVAATVLQTVYMNLIVAVVAGGGQPHVVRNLRGMLVPGILYNVAFAWLLNRTGTPGSGMLAAALAAFCTALHGSWGLGMVAARQFGALMDFGVLAKALAASLPAYLALRLLPHHGLWLPVAVVLSLVPYALAIMAWRVFTEEEVDRLTRKLRRLRSKFGRSPEPAGP